MLSLETRIATVTVYPDRARITRRGNTRLAPGTHTLVIANLPTTLIEDSVRATGKGTGKLIGVEVAEIFVTHAPEANLKELEQQLETLGDEDKQFADEEATANARLKFLDSLRDWTGHSLAKGLAYGNATLDRAQQFTEYLARELDAVHTCQRDLAQKRREQKRKIDVCQAQLESVRRVETNERSEIRVGIEASAETDFQLEVTYVVTNTQWSPLYDVRLDGDRVGLTYLAEVTQSSGEDWSNVELLLSTARVAESNEIPELDPWYVDVLRPTFAPARVAAVRSAGVPLPPPDAMMMQAMPAPVPAAEMMEATIESSGAAVTYRIARPFSAPSDNSPHKTTITILDLAAQLDYIAAPKLAEQVYLRAKIKNTSEFVLLPGSANIFHGADFVGATELERVASNEEFEAQMGVDDRIKVERELTERTVDKTLIGNTRRIFLGYKIALTNLLATPAKIAVLDQLPVARAEDIKVKMRDASPKPNDQSDLNVLKWELELKPQEKREVTFSFSVEHPREMTLTGLGT
jgi:uncharacterized protein (TIGR02231 family)